MSNRPKTYRMTTLGCRANHAEQREMEAILRAKGLHRSESGMPASLEVVHTCSVTSRAAAKSRQSIRKAARQHGPGFEPSKIIVTGCFASMAPEVVSDLLTSHDSGPEGGIIGHADEGQLTMIERFSAEVDAWLEQPAPESSRKTQGTHHLPVVTLPNQRAHHTRAEIRIQDGCDAHCTFCIIPRLRPTLRSKKLVDVTEEARRLVDLGHTEIVLTGIFIGAFGHRTAIHRKQDFQPETRLSELVDAVAAIEGVQRLRISSMEPMDVTEDLLDAMVANTQTVVPHLHLPLQSGSDRILRRMNRQYDSSDYLRMIQMAEEALTLDGLPPAITTDVICGFPGETEEDFQRTLDMARRVGYLHMHSFRFSPREGTAAARWKNQFVHNETIQSRVRRLHELENDPQDGLAIRYRRKLLGREHRVIVEQADPNRPGRWLGRCDHYEMLSVEGHFQKGQLVRTIIENLDESPTPARIISSDHRLQLMPYS